MRRPIKKLAPIQFAYMIDYQPVKYVHSHSEYEILYFHRGASKYKLGEQILELKPGDLLLMNGMTLHGPQVQNGESYCRTVIHFDPAYIDEFTRFPYTLNVRDPFLRSGNTKITLCGENRLRFERQLAEMSGLHHQTHFAAHCRFQTLFLDLLFLIREIYEEHAGLIADQPLNAKTVKEHHVRDLFLYLEEHYTRDFDLRSLEVKMHVNKYYLSKLFKEMTGMTIFQYVMLKRIHQAKARLLLRPGQSVTEIGVESGFKQPAHFTRAFKAFTGSTPTQFRNNNCTILSGAKERFPVFEQPVHKPPVRIRYSEDNPAAQGPHLHSLYEIYYFQEGKCRYTIGDHRYELRPGDVLIMDGSTPHGANPDRNVPYRRTSVHFDPDYAERLCSVFGIDLLKHFRNGSHRLLRLTASQQSAIQEKLETIIALDSQANDLAFNRLHALFLDLLLMIHEICTISHNQSVNVSRPAKEKIVWEILQFIEHHYREEFRLESLEKKLHLSKNHLSRIFREVTGIRITEYLNQRRINQAMVMLQSKHKRRTIQTIGLEIGFKTHGHFTRVFKQYTGYSPQQFRQLYIQKTV